MSGSVCRAEGEAEAILLPYSNLVVCNRFEVI